MKKSKKLKGMTLIEIIVALAIFAMLGALLVTVGMTSTKTNRAATGLKEKMVDQSPYAANQKTKKQVYDESTGTYTDVDLVSEDVVIKVSLNSKTVEVAGKKYCTEQITKPEGMTAEEEEAYNNRPNAGLNFKFIDVERVDPATPEPTTEATT